MNTLLNGSLHGEEATSPNAEVALDIIPEAKSSKTGVSVEYVKDSRESRYITYYYNHFNQNPDRSVWSFTSTV